MIFGWGKGNAEPDDDDDEEIDLVLFKGAVNGTEPNMKENARLVSAGMLPAKELVTDGLAKRAGQIRMEPKGERALVTYVIDGISHPGAKYSKPEGLAITQMLKLLAGLDVKVRNKSQQGGIKAEFNDFPWEIQIIITPAEGGGERLVIRPTNLKVKLDTPTDLGMGDEMRMKVRELSSKPGVFVVVGPPGTGVTTLKYAVLRGVDAFTHQIFTLGDTGKKLDNVSVFKPNEGDPLTTTIERCLRVDGDVMLVPDFKEFETASSVFKFCERAAMVTELPAKDTANAIPAIIKVMNGDAETVSKGLNGVLTQKLIRTLCPDCKQAFKPNAAFLKKVGLPEDLKVLYRKPKYEEDEPEPDPCDKCEDIGYFGQVAMFELLEMTDEMRTLVASNPDPAAIKTQARKEKMVTLQQDALRLVAEGKTSLDEVQRVFKA